MLIDKPAGKLCKEKRKRKRKMTLSVKSGQSNKKKILSALETSGIKSHTTIIMSQNTLPRLLLLLSPKRKSNSFQCCNSSQLDNPNYPCYRPSNPLLCHHNFQLVSTNSPHQCNHSKVDNWQS